MKKTFLAALIATAVLAACGGGGDNPGPAPASSQVPPSASQSVDGFVSYLKQLVVSAADMLEPVDTTGVVGPSDETSEPQTVD
jgi:ABC-type glycerol-3-phosphate transport system substrate-binding protein